MPAYCIHHSGVDESNIGRICCLYEAVDTISPVSTAIVMESEKKYTLQGQVCPVCQYNVPKNVLAQWWTQ